VANEPPSDSRRYYLAGYLSALPEYAGRHPDALLPLADQIVAVLADLDRPRELTVPASVVAVLEADRDK
jgi:hypothetical protein